MCEEEVAAERKRRRRRTEKTAAPGANATGLVSCPCGARALLKQHRLLGATTVRSAVLRYRPVPNGTVSLTNTLRPGERA